MQIVGELTESVRQMLHIENPADTKIYLGQSNIAHIKQRHPEAYRKYGKYIPTIVQSPDYVGINKKDSSIEYVKTFSDSAGEYVKVAVRVSRGGKLFARSLYVLNTNRVNNYVEKNLLIAIDK